MAAVYVFYVSHYAVNAIFSDEWNVVPLIDAANHGQLTLGALWAQHGDNRMFIPNLIFVALGVPTRYNINVDVVFSALVFIASFVIFLTLFRTYIRRPLTVLSVTALGSVWFGLQDWECSLFGFQLAWYLIVLFLMGMLFLLLNTQRSYAFPLAMACAFAASLCCFQGLALWPVGVTCLLWTSREKRLSLMWGCGTVVALVIYFFGYTSHPHGQAVLIINGISTANVPIGYAIHHPVQLAQFLLILVGKVLPNEMSWLGGAVGAVVLAASVFVVVQSIRQRNGCLPVALVMFGVLSDAFITVGRVPFGIQAAGASHYQMFNILIVVGIVSYAWAHIHQRWMAVSGISLLLALFAIGTTSGLASSKAFQSKLHLSAQLVVNRDRIPTSSQGCYRLYGFFVNVYPVPEIELPFFDVAQKDKLGEFGSQYWIYRHRGVPTLVQCVKA